MKANRYSEPGLKKPHRDKDLMQCDCKPPSPVGPVRIPGCGDDCGCRISFIECDPDLCPCGTLCSNQTIRKGQGAGVLEVFETGLKGKGVRCRSDIKKGKRRYTRLRQMDLVDTLHWRELDDR